MEEFDDDDFSELYADVEVQASSAISGMNKLKETVRRDKTILDNATGGLPQMPAIDGELLENATRGENGNGNASEGEGVLQEKEGDLTTLSLENSDGDEQQLDVDYDNGSNSSISQSRGSRCTAARPSLDNENHVSVDSYGSEEEHIFYSEDENNNEVHDYDSDGTTESFDGRDSSSKRVPSSKGPESSHSGQIQHSPVSARPSSPSAAHSNDSSDRSYKHLMKHSSRPISELHESADYYPLKKSRSQGVKPNTRDGRYCERDRSPNRRELKPHRRSNDTHNLRTCFNDEDASYGFDVGGQHDTHQSTFSRGKHDDYYHWKNMPYSEGSEILFPYKGGHFPDHHLKPSYMKNHYWNTPPSFGYEACWYDNHNVSRNENYPEKKRNMMDKALNDDWYHNERTNVVEDMTPFNFEDSRKFKDRYSYAGNIRGSQFNKRSNDMQFRRKTKRYDLSPVHECNDDFMEEKYRRFKPTSYRNRDLDHKYDRIPLAKRERESPGTGKRRYHSPRDKYDYSWHMENEDNGRRYIKHRPLPFHSYKEPFALNNERFKGADGPKSGTTERYVRCLRQERDREHGRYSSGNAPIGSSESLRYHEGKNHLQGRRHYQQSTTTFRNIKYRHDRDQFVRRKHYQHSEFLHCNDKYESRHLDDMVLYSKGPAYQFESISRTTRIDDRYAPDCVSEFVDDREVDTLTYKLINDGINKLKQCPFVRRPDSYVIYPRCQDSVDPHLFFANKKSSRRTPEAEDALYYGRSASSERNDDQDHKYFEDLNNVNPEKAILSNKGKIDTKQSVNNLHAKFSDNQQDELLNMEEGQIIITEEVIKKPMGIECVLVCENLLQNNNIEPASNGNRVVAELDDQRIQEIIAKMEKRRERFKDPITANRDSGMTSKLLIDLDAEISEDKIERPTRKRRWVGN